METTDGNRVNTDIGKRLENKNEKASYGFWYSTVPQINDSFAQDGIQQVEICGKILSSQAAYDCARVWLSELEVGV